MIDASPDGSLVAFSTDSAAYTLPTSLPVPEKVADIRVASIDVSGNNQTAFAGESGLFLIGSGDTVIDVTKGVGEARDVAWVDDGSRAVFTRNRDNPNHFEPWSVDADGNDLRKLGSTHTDPGTPFAAVLLASPSANEILLLLDAADGTQQLSFGPADGSGPLEQLSPAPGETGSADDDVKVAPDGSAAHFRSDGALYAADLDTGETERVSAAGPGAVTRFEPTTGRGVVFVEGVAVFGGEDQQGSPLLFGFEGDVVDFRVGALDTQGIHVACHVRPPGGTGDRLHVAAVDGSSSDEFEFSGPFQAMAWDPGQEDMEIVWRDPALGRDVFGRYDPATGTLSSEFLLSLDRNVDAEYETVGDSIVRIESIGSGRTLASVVTEDGVTPCCLDYGSAIPLAAFSFDPAAEICSQQLVPAMTFTDVADPTDVYVRTGLLSADGRIFPK